MILLLFVRRGRCVYFMYVDNSFEIFYNCFFLLLSDILGFEQVQKQLVKLQMNEFTEQTLFK